MPTYVKRGKSIRAIVKNKGKVYTKSFPTKAEATYWAVNRERELQSGDNIEIPDRSFGELLEEYRTRVSPSKRGVKWEGIRLTNFQNDKKLADTKLVDLNETHFAEWRDRRLAVVSSSTVRREWNILSNAVNVAIDEWKWLKTNPLKSIKKPVAPKPRERLITDDEITALKYASDYQPDLVPVTIMQRVAAIFLFSIETGMRLKEMTRLTWDKVYLDQNYCHVTDDSKTGRRDVPLSGEAIRIIEQLKKCKSGKFVFQLTESQVDSNYRKLKKMALVEGFTFHDTKHLACTRLAQKLTPYELGRMVGTRDLRTLMIYFNASAQDISKKL